MKQKLPLLGSILMVLFIFSCTSGKKAFEKGNYDEGLLKAINRLRQSPKNKKARETLHFGYPLTINWHKDNIEQIKRSNDVFAQEQMHYEYKQINYLNDEIRRCLACLRAVRKMETFLDEERETAQKGAEVRYNMGTTMLQESKEENNKNKAMDAFYHFETANHLVQGYSDALDKMEEARWQATTKVVIEEVATGSAMLDISADFFYNKIQDFMTQMQVSPFVQFYSPVEAQSLNITQPDQVIQLRFDHFVVGQVYHKESEYVRSKDSVVIGTVKDSNDELIDVYGTVRAKMIVNRKQVTSNGLLDLKIIDFYSSRVLTQEKLPGEFIWFTEWGNFNGDEKALNEEDWAIVRSKEIPPPPPQDLFVAFTQPIFNQVTGKLSNFYSNYR